MKPTVVLTGGIACGKSTFAKFLAEAGCEILDADDIVHQLQAPGGTALPLIRKAFGDSVFRPDNTLDRAALAAIVFPNPTARRQLEAIMHPLVRDAFNAWHATPADTLRVAVIPLLFEVGWHMDWPHITCLASSSELQLQRLRERGHSDAEARARIQAQLPLSQKINRAHCVVWNNGTLDELHAQALQWIKKVTK